MLYLSMRSDITVGHVVLALYLFVFYSFVSLQEVGNVVNAYRETEGLLATQQISE